MQIFADRHALHQIPELDKNLPETIAYLKSVLADLRCTVTSPAEGCLAAWFDFSCKTAIAFRADADALPIAEKTGAPYASRHEGKMHACGHDGHMAILLELARRINEKENLPHNVLLVFQSAEETTGGARDLCETGIFEKHNVTAIFGLHLWPGLPAGTVASRKKELMARSSEVTVDIYGKSAHIAKADEGIDALEAAAEFYLRALALERSLPEGTFRLLKFGKLHSGTVRNALSAHSHLEGSLRAFQDEVFDSLRQGLQTIAEDVQAAFGCTVKLHFSDGYPAVMNPEDLFDRVAKTAPVSLLDKPYMTAEDFSWYQRYLPGMFFFLGLGDTPALHADTFDFDEAVLIQGADFFEKLAEEFR